MVEICHEIEQTKPSSRVNSDLIERFNGIVQLHRILGDQLGMLARELTEVSLRNAAFQNAYEEATREEEEPPPPRVIDEVYEGAD